MTYYEFELSAQDEARIEAARRRTADRLRMSELARRLRALAESDIRDGRYPGRRSR
jgi:hypothetical protein